MAQAITEYDGFDDYAVADLDLEGWTVGAPSGTFGSGRVAGNGYNVSTNSTSTKAVTSDAHPHLLLAWKIANATQSETIELREGATVHGRLVYNGNGTFTISRAGSIPETSANQGIVANTFYHLEIDYYIHDTLGFWEVRLNGTVILGRTTGLDTRNAGTSGVCDTVAVQSPGGGVMIDDFIYASGGGSSAGTFYGDCRVISQFATSDGATAQFTPSTGTDHYALVDETAENGDTDYNSDSTAGHRDLYGYPSLGVTGTVQAVGIHAVARKSDAGARSLGLSVRVASTTYDHASTDEVLTSYAPFGTTSRGHGIWETNPAGGSWSVADVNSSQYGVKTAT